MQCGKKPPSEKKLHENHILLKIRLCPAASTFNAQPSQQILPVMTEIKGKLTDWIIHFHTPLHADGDWNSVFNQLVHRLGKK